MKVMLTLPSAVAVLLFQAQQLNLLQEASAKIKSVLPKAVLKSFIPPYNTFNNDTIRALQSTGFNYMSSENDLDLPPYPLSGQTFYRFPEGAATSVETSLIRGIPASQTMAQISAQIGKYGYSVVMMHPQEFSNVQNGAYVSTLNTTQYNQLLSLISMVQNANLRIVNLDKVNY